MPYKVARTGNDYSDAQPLDEALAWANTNAKKVGPRYALGTSPIRFRRTLMRALERELTEAKPTDVVVFTAGREQPRDPVEFKIRKVIPTPPARPTSPQLLFYTGNPVDYGEGNARIVEIARWCARTEPRIRCNGWRFTRPVAGTTTPSQHSAWPPAPGRTNAADLAIYKDETPSHGADTNALAAFVIKLVAECARGGLPARRVIFRDKDYREDHGWRPIPYTGEYHGTHTHVEGTPAQTGTPVGWG